MANRRWAARSFGSLLALLAGASATAGDDQFVPFVIPLEMPADSRIQLPKVPPFTVDGPRVVTRDGHFLRDSRRFRVWGVNLCFGANFPTHQDAPKLAARLAAFGVNSVRFHHMDCNKFPDGIWDRSDETKLSSEALGRLDYFIDQLARHGICANLNLHVSRTHSRALKLPQAEKLANYDKMADLFTPELIAAQRQYARDLLTHENPYRKVRYADDPAVAFVEINNEDSLFMWGAERELPNLPPHYAGLLRQQFGSWLKKRYGTRQALAAAWNAGAQPLGANLLAGVGQRTVEPGKQAWRLEQHGDCKAQVRDEPRASVSGGATPQAVYIDIATSDPTGWHIQYNVSPVALKAGGYYTLIFKARAPKPRMLTYSAGMDHPPYDGLGLGGQAKLDGDPKRDTPRLGSPDRWQEVRAGFVAKADEDKARVSLQVGGSDVPVELEDVRLCPGGIDGLREGESIDAGNVELFASNVTRARAMAALSFLADTEKAYFDGMRQFIKKELGCQALVTGTIVFGPLGLQAQSDMDYLDGHAYWHHPRFPNRPWDPADWTVEQEAMVDCPDQSPLFRLAAQRLAGKPYTVSEYNHPAPNDYQAECVPLIAAFAAGQEWDGVWLFAYSHRKDDWRQESFGSFFDIDANPAKWALMPAGTLIFREGQVPPNREARVARLNHDAASASWAAQLHAAHGHDLLAAAGIGPQDLWRILESRLSVSLEPIADSPWPATAASGAAGQSIRWTGGAGKGAFSADVPSARVMVERAATGDGKDPAFSVMTCNALDGLPIAQSRRMLVTVVGRCENTGMGFTPDRRSVGRNWGKAPVLIQPLGGSPSAMCGKLGIDPQTHVCTPLGPDGRPLADAKPTGNAPTMWLLVEKK